MSERDQLLAVIAAAQAKLAGLEHLPEDEPGAATGEELCFRAVVRSSTGGKNYTYLVLRTADGQWYRTGVSRSTAVAGPTYWPVLREFFASHIVVSWDALIVADRETLDEAQRVTNDYVNALQLLARHGFEGGSAVDRVSEILDQLADSVDGKSR